MKIHTVILRKTKRTVAPIWQGKSHMKAFSWQTISCGDISGSVDKIRRDIPIKDSKHYHNLQ